MPGISNKEAVILTKIDDYLSLMAKQKGLPVDMAVTPEQMKLFKKMYKMKKDSPEIYGHFNVSKRDDDLYYKHIRLYERKIPK